MKMTGKKTKSKSKVEEDLYNGITLKLMDFEVSVSGHEDLDKIENRCNRIVNKFFPNKIKRTNDKSYYD